MSSIPTSEELPPTENLPIFDNAVFNAGDLGLTYNTAKTHFLTYPSAQGTETLLNTNVIGNLSVTNNLTLSGDSSNINLSGTNGIIIFPSGQTQTNSATATFNESTTSSTVSYILTKYYNSTINFTSNQTTTITIINPIIGTYLKIYNNCQYYVTLNIDGVKTFTGEWGNSDPTLRLNPNSWSLLYATTTTSWNVIDRSPNQIFDTLTISASISYSPHYNLLNAYVPFNSSSSAYLVTIPAPSDIYSRNKYMKITNVNTSNSLTISNSVNFLGKYGSGSTTLTIPVNTWVEINSNGTNWLVNNRSVENQIYTLANFTVLSNTIVSNFQYINADVHLTSTYIGETTLIIPEATASYSQNQQYIFYNDNCRQGSGSTNGQSINLTISSSYFKGLYCDNANNQTTLKLPSNSKSIIYSNGTNWIVKDYCSSAYSTPSLYLAPQSGSFVITRPFPKFGIMNSGLGNQLYVVPPAPTASDLGTDLILIRGWTTGSSTIYASGSVSVPIFMNNSINGPVEINTICSSRMVRCIVAQFGYAGTGTVSLTQNVSTCSISGISSQAIIQYNSVLTIPTTPSSVQIKINITGIGGNGTYYLGANWSGSTGNYTFTCNDTYFWIFLG